MIGVEFCKWLLAYEIRRNHGRRAVISIQEQPHASLCPERAGPSPRMFTSLAAGDHGFRGGRPFAQTQLKLREHYGFEIGESTIQRITLGHARAVFESDRPSVEFPQAPGRPQRIIVQIDGGMVPVVEPDATQKDKRKGKKLLWREAKISLAHAKGGRTPVYGGGIGGGVEEAARRLFACAVRAGGFPRTRGGRRGAVDRRADR